MRTSKLPEELINTAHKHGIYGWIYIPKKFTRSDIAILETFAWFNYVYSAFGTNYSERKIKRSDKIIRSLKASLSRHFSKNVCSKIFSNAFKKWKNWYFSHEARIIEQIHDITSFSGLELFTAVKFYHSCRLSLLLKEPLPDLRKDSELYESFLKIRELARNSISKLPEDTPDIRTCKYVPDIWNNYKIPGG